MVIDAKQINKQTNKQTTQTGAWTNLNLWMRGSRKAYMYVLFPHCTCTVKNSSILTPKNFMKKENSTFCDLGSENFSILFSFEVNKNSSNSYIILSILAYIGIKFLTIYSLF